VWGTQLQFIKFDIFGSFLRIGSSAGVNKGVLYRERNSQVWNRAEQGDRTFGAFRGGNAVGEGGLAGATVGRRSCHRAGSELGLGDAMRHAPRHAGTGGAGMLIFLFLLDSGGAWPRVGGCGLLPGRPLARIDLRLGGRRGGFLLRGKGATVGDEVLHGHDHGEGFDLAGNAASGHFGAEVGDFPEAVQYFFAVQVQAALSFGVLLDELLLHGGAVLEHVGADPGFGFCVGCRVGVQADGFSGLTVGHAAREDQAGKGYFLIGDGVADFILGHKWLRNLREVRDRGFHCAWRRGGVQEKIPRWRDAWIALFETGIGCDTGQR
jgi:hypothetical protein